MEEGRISSKKIAREFSAGGVVFKKSKDKHLWLVTKSSPSEVIPRSVWRLAKGWLDDQKNNLKPGPLASGKSKATEEQIQKAALKEVAEEGGISAKIINKIGTEKYFLTVKGEKILKFVTFYLMEWQKDLPEGTTFETEKVEWLEYLKARGRLSYDGEKKVLDKAKELLDKGIQESLL